MPQSKKPTVPIKLEHWFNATKSIDQLRVLLADPALQQAIADPSKFALGADGGGWHYCFFYWSGPTGE